MNNEAIDFMKHEYDQMVTAFFTLGNQLNDWFKSYLALVGLPLTVLAAVLKLGSGSGSTSITALPEVVVGLLVAVSILGLLVLATMVHTRMEMLLYIRTMNVVRRYFADLDSSLRSKAVANSDTYALLPQVSKYLVLPTCDTTPKFHEPGTAVRDQVLLMGFLDGLIIGVAILNFFQGHTVPNDYLKYWLSAIVGILWAALHYLLYRLIAWGYERRWVIVYRYNLESKGQPPKLSFRTYFFDPFRRIWREIRGLPDVNMPQSDGTSK
jgi:hypothetical protein